MNTSMSESILAFNSIRLLSEKFIYIILIGSVGLGILSPLLYEQALLLSSFEDDFFYYLKIAENIVLGNGSTFNGVVTTNGYHPLWLLFLVFLVKIIHLSNIELLVGIKIAIAIIVFFSFFIFHAYAKTFIRHQYLRIVFLVFSYYWYAERFAFHGMETLITIPFFLLFLISYLKNKNYFLIGFFASLVVLSRLDSIVILITLFSINFYIKGISIKRFGKLFFGAALLPLYLIINHYLFETTMPVSGLAKTVVAFDTIHVATFKSLFNILDRYGYVFCLFYISSCLLLFKSKNEYSSIKITFLTAIISVPVFYLQTSIRSDWCLWVWYLYPLLFSFIMLVPHLDRFLSNYDVKMRYGYPVFVATIFSLFIAYFYLYFHYIEYEKDAKPIILGGMKIRDFEREHPGIYAMGDRAGVVGYLLKSPVIQLEGLVMDIDYLKLLKKETKFEKILNHYRVDYYIGTNIKKLDQGCFFIEEPEMSKGFSPQIKSKLCWKEIYSFKVDNVRTYILQNQGLG